MNSTINNTEHFVTSNIFTTFSPYALIAPIEFGTFYMIMALVNFFSKIATTYQTAFNSTATFIRGRGGRGFNPMG